MDIHLIIPTQTYAEKARQLLSRYRYPCRIQKTVTREGCVFRLSAAAEPDDILRLLSANGIPARLERS